ncbi:MAG TPA: peptidylprolyl isomerase [Spirochaeta sp.]|nr:peptidylprolyl isomerase [Spirochaeta sp.]
MQTIIKMKNGGELLFDLYPEKAPLTVKNFMELVNKGFYNGLTFHRVVRDYVIQGGSEDNTCMCPTDFTITGEFTENGFDTGLTHKRGALSMARDDDFNSAGTQFFVAHKDAHKLDGRYAAFGQLVEGFDVLDAIATVDTAPPEAENRPLQPQIIESIRIVK